MTDNEYRVLSITRGIVYSVSPTGKITPIRATYFLAADEDDPLVDNVCLDRRTAERESLKIRGLDDAILHPLRLEN